LVEQVEVEAVEEMMVVVVQLLEQLHKVEVLEVLLEQLELQEQLILEVVVVELDFLLLILEELGVKEL
jgi:hypothetical protein